MPAWTSHRTASISRCASNPPRMAAPAPASAAAAAAAFPFPPPPASKPPPPAPPMAAPLMAVSTSGSNMVAPVSSPPSTTPSSSSSSTPDAMKQLSGNFSTFLTLLTTQLKNQDPTSPMDSNAFTQQLVMYSQVEQQIDTNDNLKTLISQGTTGASAMAATYLGKKVSVTNGNASLSGGSAAWTYNLDAAAASTQLAITDANGRTVYTANGETTAGNHSFTWNGKDA